MGHDVESVSLFLVSTVIFNWAGAAKQVRRCGSALPCAPKSHADLAEEIAIRAIKRGSISYYRPLELLEA